MKYEILRGFLKHFALKYGSEFTLSSGKKSKYYVDCSEVTSMSKGIFYIANSMYLEIRDRFPKAMAVGGMELKSVPIISAISLMSYYLEQSLDSFIIRKTVKDHGTQNRIEGLPSVVNTRVVIIDDVVTTGDSIVKSIEICRDHRLTPIGAMALVDRGEGGKRKIKKAGVPFYSLFSIKDLIK